VGLLALGRKAGRPAGVAVEGGRLAGRSGGGMARRAPEQMRVGDGGRRKKTRVRMTSWAPPSVVYNMKYDLTGLLELTAL
jgi:hypothetical protein